ncbi:hypothetical protein [Corynebacterium accolens]|uniref:hypothetical protein n=1 Tax=Corynebacterium accolens TaxID=38284 RepID=UPI00254E501D|nr:hypothetical protein [Corynebacterium accolens]MDK8680350.1 hypothetical protein [Corynebacterium accolens]
MQELPLVTATNSEQWILDTPRLRVIDREIERVGDNHEHIGLVDAALADFLTPTAPSQHVPTVADIRRFIRDFIDTHQLAVDDTDEVEPALNVAVHNNRATISLTCDKATAAIIARHIDTQADNNRCGAGEALIQLILDNTHTKVAINTFTTDTTTDDNNAAVRLPSFSGHPISADFVSVTEDVHCESMKSVSRIWCTPKFSMAEAKISGEVTHCSNKS